MTVVRATLTYIIGSIGERAANTVHFETPGFASEFASINPLGAPIATWWTTVKAGVANVVQPERLRVDVIDETTGRIQRGYDLTTPTGTGTGGATLLPPQCSMVISMRTNQAGPRNRGRMYLPPASSAQLTSNGRMLTSFRDAAATATATLFTSTKALTVPWTAVVWSRVALATEPITSVSVGDVFDTQRRRREDLVEQRYTVAVP